MNIERSHRPMLNFSTRNAKGLILLLFSLVIVSFSASKKSSLIDDIVARLSEYNASHPVQKVFVSHDKAVYITNESINYTAFVTEGQHFIPSNSGILYLQLLGPTRQPVIQQKLKFSNGITHGKLLLPDSLVSGQYVLSAYTNWMRNFDQRLFFNKKINIYSASQSIEFEKPIVHDDLQLNFYPEGGNLVDGIASKIGIACENVNGDQENVSGAIYNSRDEQILSFNTNKEGIGTILLKPEKHLSYYAKINSTPDKKYPLPKSDSLGTVMQVQNSHPDKIKTIVQSTDFSYKELVLIVQSNNQVYYSATSKNSKKGFVVSIPKADLPNGIAQISLFSGIGDVLSERLIFIEKNQVDPIKVELDKASYKAKEKVEVKFSGDESVFSFSINNQDISSFNIRSYLLLHSEIGATLNNAGIDYLSKDPQTRTALDNLLLTKKLIRFKWMDLLTKTVETLKYTLEKDLSIKGTLTNAVSGEILSELKVTLSQPQELISYDVLSNKNGEIEVYVLDYSGNKIFYLQPIDNTKLNDKIKLTVDEVFVMPQSYKTQKSMALSDDTKTLVQQLRENQQIRNAYSVDVKEENTEQTSPMNKLTSKNYSGLYDGEIALSDFIDFPTMREVFREIVPGVSISTKGFDLRCYSKEKEKKFNGTPTFFIDGKLTNNVEYILQINPADVRSIGIISSVDNINRLGRIALNGVICINLKTGRVFSDIPSSESLINYQGLSSFLGIASFVKPETFENARIPDFKSSLYWNPEVIIKNNSSTNVSFYTSNERAKYNIRLQGISKEGVPFYVNKSLNVE